MFTGNLRFFRLRACSAAIVPSNSPALLQQKLSGHKSFDAASLAWRTNRGGTCGKVSVRRRSPGLATRAPCPRAGRTAIAICDSYQGISPPQLFGLTLGSTKDERGRG